MKFTAQLLLAVASLAALPCIHAQSASFSDGDQTYLRDFSHDNMAEVQLAQLALRTSKNPAVTTLAKKMIDDHQKLLQEANPVAMKAGLPHSEGLSLDGDADYLKLKALSGVTFDKTYIRTMAEDHHKALEAARAEHEKTRNEDMRRIAARAQEIIAGHVEMVNRIAAKIGA